LPRAGAKHRVHLGRLEKMGGQLLSIGERVGPDGE
jgi:hypothetical protein